MSVGGFSLERKDIGFFGEGLSRPECVLAEADGTLWVSDDRGGATRIERGGRQTRLGSIPGLPNGLALEPGGSLLVANIADGVLYRLDRDGGSETVLDRIDGRKLGALNFVYCDGAGGRIWLTVSTRTEPRLKAVAEPIPDGYVVLLEHGRARIAAEGFCFTNELRIDRARRFLYVAETARGRVVRLPLAADGGLGAAEAFGPDPIFPGARVDGIAFDAEGNLWVTEVTRNGIFVITPAGACHCVFEDPAGETIVFPASLAFAGPDRRTVYVGSIRMPHLAVFRAPVAGAPLAHWAA